MSSTSSSPSMRSPTGTDTSSALAPLYLPPHIVVLVHGNNGAPSDFDCVHQTLRQKYSAEELLVIKSSVNHTQTSLGVDVGGEKLALEIVNTILKYDLSPKIDSYKFSIIGHSLGGLYARYAMPQVQEELQMLDIQYVSFVTLSTPHLGSRRPRATSTIKNLYRLGVHTVLASKNLYGQTGVDLLVSNESIQSSDDDATALFGTKRPVLETMSDADSLFMQALRKFTFCTLVAMADGDVIVPFASASIRNFNPYPSHLLTTNFPHWRWHICHHGFGKAPLQLQERLYECVDHELQLGATENHKMGLALGCEDASHQRFASIEGEYDCDNKREVEFTFKLICDQQRAVQWRRVDIVVEPSGVKGKLRLHDWPVNKMQLPDCGAMGFIDLLTDIIGSDHGLEMRPLRVAPPVVVVAAAAATSSSSQKQDEEELRISTIASDGGDQEKDQHDQEQDQDQCHDDHHHESSPLRLSLHKWAAEKKQIGAEHFGNFVNQVKSRFATTGTTSQHGSTTSGERIATTTSNETTDSSSINIELEKADAKSIDVNGAPPQSKEELAAASLQ